jgi:serine/threonine protein kinase/Tol biopolymer transport system component
MRAATAAIAMERTFHVSADKLTPGQEELRQASPTDERPEFEDRVGSVVAGYVLEQVVGSGGMGVVYRARHGESGRVVALKLMLPEVASNRKFRERFILEARVAPELDHPNIVPVFEVGESRAQLFIAMRLVEGLDLKEVIEREGALQPRRVLGIMHQAAAALDHAHERGMVHRDVKPQNLLLAKTEEGEDHVYLTDFGLVKPTSEESTASRTTDVFGSIQYMSPEQIEGITVDGRADVYSLACVAFECLTGKPPFERPNEISLLWAHVHEEPPRASSFLSSLPGGLDLVLRQAMSKHPDDRYLTCGEFVDALEDGAKKHRRQLVAPVMRPLVKRIPRRKTEREVWAPNYFPELSRVRKLTDRTNWVQVTAVVVLLCLLAAALVQLGREGGLPQAAADVADLAQKVGEEIGALATDADVRSEEGVPSSLRASDSVEDITYRDAARFGEAGDVRPVPRRRDAIFGGRRSQAATVGGPPQVAPPPPTVPRIVWVQARDIAGGVSDLWVMRANGEGATQLTSTAADENWPDWSPDGRQIAFVRAGDIWIMEPGGSPTRKLGYCSEQRPCSEPDWSPDGERLVFTRANEPLEPGELATDDASIVIAHLRSGELQTVPTLAAEARTRDGSVTNATWSPDGRLLAGTCEHRELLCLVRLNGKVVRRLASGFPSKDWSPDGRMVAGEYQGEIGLAPVDGSGYVTLDVPGSLNFDPSWSDDGAELVFDGWAVPGNGYLGDLFKVSADGASVVQLTRSPQTADVQPDWWGPAS